MVSHHFFYQLALLAIIWLFVLHLTGAKPGVTIPPVPAKPKRTRSTEPQAFEGLTHKPPCALCERDTTPPNPSAPVPPDPMSPTHRRPRTVDTSMHFCPHRGCDYRGWLGLNNLRANGHPSGGPWRPFHCRGCNGFFPEHHGTIFHGKQAAVELMVRVLACLAEGLGIPPPRGSSRSTPLPSCTGWWKRQSNCGPFAPTSCVTSTCASSNSTSCMPCCEG